MHCWVYPCFVGVYALYCTPWLCCVMNVHWRQSGLCGAYLGSVLLLCALWGELVGLQSVNTA